MIETLHHQNGYVESEPTGDGRFHVRVHMSDPNSFVTGPAWTTAYPRDLVAAILEVKEPAWLCDELQRDEDPTYMENDFRHDVLGFIDPEDFRGKQVLDFGCGCGASTTVVSRLLPGAELTGVELDAPSLEIAKMRAHYYGLDSSRLLLSPDPENLPPNIGDFDFIPKASRSSSFGPRLRLTPTTTISCTWGARTSKSQLEWVPSSKISRRFLGMVWRKLINALALVSRT